MSLKKLEKYFKGDDKETQAFGVKFGDVFKAAQKYKSMSLEEIEKTSWKQILRNPNGRSEHYGLSGQGQEDYSWEEKKNFLIFIYEDTTDSIIGIL